MNGANPTHVRPAHETPAHQQAKPSRAGPPSRATEWVDPVALSANGVPIRPELAAHPSRPLDRSTGLSGLPSDPSSPSGSSQLQPPSARYPHPNPPTRVGPFPRASGSATTYVSDNGPPPTCAFTAGTAEAMMTPGSRHGHDCRQKSDLVI